MNDSIEKYQEKIGEAMHHKLSTGLQELATADPSFAENTLKLLAAQTSLDKYARVYGMHELGLAFLRAERKDTGLYFFCERDAVLDKYGLPKPYQSVSNSLCRPEELFNAVIGDFEFLSAEEKKEVVQTLVFIVKVSGDLLSEFLDRTVRNGLRKPPGS